LPQGGFVVTSGMFKGVETMLALEELKRTLAPYKAKLIEMGDSL